MKIHDNIHINYVTPVEHVRSVTLLHFLKCIWMYGSYIKHPTLINRLHTTHEGVVIHNVFSDVISQQLSALNKPT